jgi:hypothetical protein
MKILKSNLENIRKLLMIVPILLALSPVFAVTCEQQCDSDGYDYYICSGIDYTSHSECQAQPSFSYCYNSYVEKLGTTCFGQCFCYEINMCGVDNTECNSACSSIGCSGTTFDIQTPTNLPTDTFVGDWSDWYANVDNTGGIGAFSYIECHVKDPSGDNYYPIADSCGQIYSGSDINHHIQIQVNEVGTWELLSCSVYEAQGTGICNPPYVYRDEYDFFPTHTWEVTSSSCPLTTFGECEAYQDGFLKCFANHIGECEYYSLLGLYCWSDFRDCETFYVPARYCSAGACFEYSGTTPSTTTTTIVTTSGTTTILATTTTQMPLEDLGEPFETSDLPNELRFLSNLSSGLFNMSGSILGGLILIVFALSIATIIIIIGKRSLD